MAPLNDTTKTHKVTYNGRLEVDTNQLVYSTQAQHIMEETDRKIADRKQDPGCECGHDDSRDDCGTD